MIYIEDLTPKQQRVLAALQEAVGRCIDNDMGGEEIAAALMTYPHLAYRIKDEIPKRPRMEVLA